METVQHVDLERYAGSWFEIARFPNRFQRRCIGDVRATYVRRVDGRIDVINSCRSREGRIEARGIARITDPKSNAKLKVSFAPKILAWLPFVWGDYWIVGLATDYTWAVVGSPNRKYLWILARTPALDESSLEAARAAARDRGFNVARLLPANAMECEASRAPTYPAAPIPAETAVFRGPFDRR